MFATSPQGTKKQAGKVFLESSLKNNHLKDVKYEYKDAE